MRYLKNRIAGIALGSAAVGGLALAGAANASAATPPGGGRVLGYVYTSTNSTAGNQVEVFARKADGTLALAGTYNTGGAGNGVNGLSQGAVTLSPDQRTLLVVDGGSDQVSDFAVLPGGALRLRNVVASGGTAPTSVAINGGLAEVLNSGGLNAEGPMNVTGLRATGSGLAPIAGGSQPLSSGASGPTDVVISPGSTRVAVAETLSNTIDTFAVGQGGTLAPAVTSAPDAPSAFAELFTPAGRLLVADFGSADNSALSSYRVAPSGVLNATQAPVSDGQNEGCWIVKSASGDAFVVNSSSDTVSSYHVSASGQVTFLRNTGVATGATPVDEALSSDGRNLYVLNGNQDELTEFSAGSGARLTAIGTQALPTQSLGLAAS